MGGDTSKLFIPKIPGKLRNSVAYYTISHLSGGKRPGAFAAGMPDPKRPPSSLRRVTSTRRAYPPPGKYVRRGLLVLIKSALSASPGMPVV